MAKSIFLEDSKTVLGVERRYQLTDPNKKVGSGCVD